MVNFDCLKEEYADRYEFMACLQGINQEYNNTKYVDLDDICRFLRLIKDKLFSIIDQLHQQDDSVGIIITIHERTREKVDLLEEFNNIHEILDRYEEHLGLKMRLSILKEVIEQCKIYDSRASDVIEKAKEYRQQDRITREDYSFLRE